MREKLSLEEKLHRAKVRRLGWQLGCVRVCAIAGPLMTLLGLALDNGAITVWGLLYAVTGIWGLWRLGWRYRIDQFDLSDL
jgi:hypothetical protein